MFAEFLKDESGVTAIEYTLIAALIAVAAIVAMQFVGTEIGTTFNYIGDTLSEATESGGDASTGSDSTGSGDDLPMTSGGGDMPIFSR